MSPPLKLPQHSTGKRTLKANPTMPLHETALSSSESSRPPNSLDISIPHQVGSIKVRRCDQSRKISDRYAPALEDTSSGQNPDDNATLTRVSKTHLHDGNNTLVKDMHASNKEDSSTCEASAVDIISLAETKYLKHAGSRVSILPEWIGTSPYYIMEGIAIQKYLADRAAQGHLKELIKYRDAIAHGINVLRYHPAWYIHLSKIDHKLGFCDIGTANAHRALILIKAGLCIDKQTYPCHLGEEVCSCIAPQFDKKSKITVTGALKVLHVQALRQLLYNLLGSGALWEGLSEAKDALTLFPDDKELVETRRQLKEGFEGKCRAIDIPDESVENAESIVAYTRRGTIYQKPYPWVDKALYSRSSALVKEVNKSFGSAKCEVKQITLSGRPLQVNKMDGSQDVGPLGVFASQDIREGELLMVDKWFISMSDVPSSRLTHCDACHAYLLEPYIHQSDVIKPSCCGMVAYCSMECYDVASKGYHRIICRKDVEWLYQDPKGVYCKRVARDHSRSLLFLRIMCIVLSDRLCQQEASQEPTHPLQHPIIARMIANYPPPSKIHSNHASGWVYSESVTTAHRILQLLEIDVFTSSEFTPEVIQTIYWRLENNASGSICNLSDDRRPKRSSSTKIRRQEEDRNDEYMLCLNPNYLFFNHSCEPNVTWHGSNPDPWVDISWLRGFNGEVLRAGCSAVWCIAARDVKKGEELKISYVGNPLGDNSEDRQQKRYMLEKWFDGGCGCRVCVREDETGVIGEEESEEGIEEDNEEDSQEDNKEESEESGDDSEEDIDEDCSED